MSATSKAVTCVRIIRDTTPSLYALPTDGRKYKEQQAKRRALAMQLATFADGDGTRIMPGADRLRNALGWSRDTLFWYLNDLKTLGFLQNEEGRTGSHGTKKRSLNLDAIQQKIAVRNPQGSESEIDESRSPKLAVSESEIEGSESGIEKWESEIHLSESEVDGHTTDTLTVTQTDTHTRHVNRQDASVCVSEKPLDDDIAEKEMDALLIAFLNKNSGTPGTFQGKQREKLKELLIRDGRDTFRAAARAWLNEQGWWNGQVDVFGPFLKGYAGYVYKATKYDEQEKQRREKTKELIERSSEIANKRHEDVWALKDEREPGPDAFLEEQRKPQS